MRPVPFLFFLALGLTNVLGRKPVKRDYSTHKYYVIKHLPSTSTSLAEVARELGVDVVEQAGELENHWVVKAPKNLSQRDTKETDQVLQKFDYLRRQAKSLDEPNAPRSLQAIRAREIVSSINYLSRQKVSLRAKRSVIPAERALPKYAKSKEIAERFGIDDPIFPQQWHLANDENPRHMMNVAPVWELGYTGKGVITAIVDDGLDSTSQDLAINFDADDSYDFNNFEDLPTPTGLFDTHGTRCAGQIGAAKNSICGVGIAHEAKIAGIRILSGKISDVDEAVALNYGYQNTSVYSCSWGPPDNGRAMQEPGYLIKKAMVEGINRGRGGKGSIFVFAAGNGAAHGDTCSFDGYTSSIYSITVAAVDHEGLHPYYSEACAANMVSAYSSGGGHYIVTTDKGVDKCATTHGGTSAAAPNVAGVMTLALQARPDLTWRDMQHLCVEHALMINPNDPDWETTATGRLYSYKYGFGVLDAHKYVLAALDWKLVKPQTLYETDAVVLGGGKMDEDGNFEGGIPIEADFGVESTMKITKEMLAESNFEKLEHIDIKVWIDHTRRGDVEVDLISPNGIRSVLGAARPDDEADTGYPGWRFMTVKHWGEDPVGEWTIRVWDQSTEEESGSFLGWNMILWGEVVDPQRATKFELPVIKKGFPPTRHQHNVPAPTTKTHARPTDFLDPEHGDRPGENTKAAFSAKPSKTGTKSSPTKANSSGAISSPMSSAHPEATHSWTSDHKWFLIFCFLLANAVIGFIVWKRAAAKKLRENYASLPTDDVPLNGMGRQPGSARQD